MSLPRKSTFLLFLVLFLGLTQMTGYQVHGQAGAPLQDPLAARAGILSLHLGEIAIGSLPDLLVNPPERFDRRKHHVLQLAGPITPERRSLLEGAGVVLGEYLPYYAYIANLDRVDPARLAALEFVAWVGEFRDEWKIDTELGMRTFTTDVRKQLEADGMAALIVSLFRGEPAEAAYQAIGGIDGASVHRIEPLAGTMTIAATLPYESIADLAQIESIQFVEEAPDITPRNNSNRWIVQSNLTNLTPFYDNGLRGENQIVGILDSAVDADHCSFFDTEPIGPLHRKIVAYNTSQGAGSHGTHVAGTACGDADANTNTRGVAYLGRLAYNSIPAFNESATYGSLQLHHSQGARVHTNSWGDDSTTSYNSLCRGFDSFNYDFEDDIILLAVTNMSSLKNPENAKNLLAVGASQDTPNQDSHCTGGTGPTADGRRKPEIYAPGCGTDSSASSTSCSTSSKTGTSMATPAVAGAAMLMRQYFVDGFYPSGAPVPGDGFTPSGALVKAALLNSAVDMLGITGYPSNQEGWGRVLADNAAFFAGDSRKLAVLDDIRNSAGLSTGATQEYSLEVLGAGERLNLTLVWTDPPASASTGTGPAAINDIDLEVVSPSGDLYRGNVFAGGQSTTGGSKDDRNNVEQVHRSTPEIGSWTVRLIAAEVNVGLQGFGLVASGDVDVVEPALRISFPDGVPESMQPGVPASFDVLITPGSENVLPGSPTLHYRYDGGDFLAEPLTPLGGDLYQATLPAAACDDTPEFYLSAEGDGGTVVTSPANAPISTYSARVGVEVELFTDDFETDKGWTVESVSLTDGEWERAIPAGGGDRGDPPTDADGSGFCYLTDNEDGNSDVDGGPTRLMSPVLDLTGTNATVSYSVWFYNDDGDDTLVTYISGNGGSSWIPVETIGPGGGGGWSERSFRVNDFITPGADVMLRFETSDNPNDSVTEAGIDAIRISSFDCEEGSPIQICGPGAVNVGCGAVTDTLFVNGSTGGGGRTLEVTPTTPLSFTIDEAPAMTGDGSNSKVVIYIWYTAPTEDDLVVLPKNLGLMCFGPFLLATRLADITFNSIGAVNKLGEHDAPGDPPLIPDATRLEFYALPGGFGQTGWLSVQGILPDTCTQANKFFSVTNGIQIDVEEP